MITEKVQINSILIGSVSSFNLPDEKDGNNGTNKIFRNLNTINFFIGQNNSGKSRFLRSIFQNKIEAYASKGLNKDLIDNHFTTWKNIIGVKYFQSGFLQNPYDIFITKLDENKGHLNINENPKDRNSNINLLKEIKKEIISCLNNKFGSTFEGHIVPHLKDKEKPIKELIVELDLLQAYLEEFSILSYKKYYIPTLRGMRRLTMDNIEINGEKEIADIYCWLTKKEYFEDLKDNDLEKRVFTGYNFYHDLKMLLLGDNLERELILEFQLFLSKNFFDGKVITLIPRERKVADKDNNKVFIRIGDAPERPIHEVGDGLQQLIIILFPIFTSSERCMFFIEEPDLFMHPGMQKALIKAMLEKDQHQYFITTHSNHLIDHDPNLYNVSTFHFSKEIPHDESKTPQEEKFNVIYCSGDKYTVMQDIGVKPSSVLLSNCTIWVEGITDRLYIKAYLEKFIADLNIKTMPFDFREKEINHIKTFKEDYHYSFIEYQGSCLDHWSFENEAGDKPKVMNAFKTCARPILIADSDADKYKQIKKIMQDLGENAWYFTKGKEIENMVSDIILIGWLKELDTKMKLDPKNIEKIMESDYFNLITGIGKYLNETLGQQGFTSKDTETTLKSDYKRKLSEFAFRFIKDELKNLNSTFKLNNEQNILCEKIIRHVLLHNKV